MLHDNSLSARRSWATDLPGGTGRAGSGLSPSFEDTRSNVLCESLGWGLLRGTLSISLAVACRVSAEPSGALAATRLDVPFSLVPAIS